MCHHMSFHSSPIEHLWYSQFFAIVHSSKVNFLLLPLPSASPPPPSSPHPLLLILFLHVSFPHFIVISWGYITLCGVIWSKYVHMAGTFHGKINAIFSGPPCWMSSASINVLVLLFVLIFYHEKFPTCREAKIILQWVLITQILPLMFHCSCFITYPPISPSNNISHFLYISK